MTNEVSQTNVFCDLEECVFTNNDQTMLPVKKSGHKELAEKLTAIVAELTKDPLKDMGCKTFVAKIYHTVPHGVPGKEDAMRLSASENIKCLSELRIFLNVKYRDQPDYDKISSCAEYIPV
jgi:hypothetical protein